MDLNQRIVGVRILNGYEYEEVVVWSREGSDWREPLLAKLSELRERYNELHCEALYCIGDPTKPEDCSWVRLNPSA
jgi:hypothetical protein